MVYMLSCLFAYLIGSVSFSIIFSKKFAGFDVREKGSHNAGTTNVLRTVGAKAAVLTLVCDILKGVLAILFALWMGKLFNATEFQASILVTLAGFLVVLGHTFPIYFGFKGGKGVATALGVLLMTNWQIGLICLVFALIIMAITRMVSLGSISAAILFPVLCLFLNSNFIIFGDKSKIIYIIFGILMALLVIFNHRSNIKRLANGTENKLSFKKKNNVDVAQSEETTSDEPVEVSDTKKEVEESKTEKSKKESKKSKK